MEKVNFSLERKYSFEDVKTEATGRGQFVSGFIGDCIDSFMLRKSQNPLFHQVVFERSHDAGEEWRMIDRTAEEAIVNDLLERERCGVVVTSAERALLKKHCVGNDYLFEKTMAEAKALSVLNVLFEKKLISTDERNKITLAVFARIFKENPTDDIELQAAIVKTMLANSHLMQARTSISAVQDIRCDLDGAKLAETISTIDANGSNRKTEVRCKKCGFKKTVK